MSVGGVSCLLILKNQTELKGGCAVVPLVKGSGGEGHPSADLAHIADLAPPPPCSALLLPLTAGLPNDNWSSDHVALMVEFRYVQPASGAAGGGGTGAAAAAAL
jgi:hypothetical protein